MNIHTPINPSFVFYGSYKKDIEKVRKGLFKELNCISSEFGKEARKILMGKIKSNKGRPLLGELFPWIIKDLIKGNTKATHDISRAWLAIYLYTLFLDEFVDNPAPLNSKQLMTGSVLAKIGLLKISKFTNNTPYEKYIDESLSFSAYSQNLDIHFQKAILATTDKKASYSKGKNHVILACAGALAAENSKHSQFITQFTESLLLALQYLDDVADYKEDFKSNNFTVLLNDTFKKSNKFRIKEISDKELLEELISTGALQRVIDKIQVLLNQAITVIQKHELNVESKKTSIDFFFSLQINISSFNSFLKKECMCYKDLSVIKKKEILYKTKKFIPLIAQST